MWSLYLRHSGQGWRQEGIWAVASGGGGRAPYPPSYRTGVDQACPSPRVAVLEATL